MSNVAAHLVDRVLPAVPVRQWVLSLPFELRRLAAYDAGVLSALSRTFHDAVFVRYAAWATIPGAALASLPPSGRAIRSPVAINKNTVQRDDWSMSVFAEARSQLPDGSSL